MKLTESLWAKITAVFLVFFATVGFALGAAGSIAANELGLYVDVDIPYVESASYRNRAAAFAGSLAWDYYNDRDSFARTVEQGYSQYSAGNTNIVFTISDPVATRLEDEGLLPSQPHGKPGPCAKITQVV